MEGSVVLDRADFNARRVVMHCFAKSDLSTLPSMSTVLSRNILETASTANCSVGYSNRDLHHFYRADQSIWRRAMRAVRNPLSVAETAGAEAE